MNKITKEFTIKVIVNESKVKEFYPNYRTNFKSISDFIDFVVSEIPQDKMNSFGYKIKFLEDVYKPYAISTSDGHDEDWTYYDSELEAHETFEYMKSYETDIHLYKLNDDEYEVIDSWWIDDEK